MVDGGGQRGGHHSGGQPPTSVETDQLPGSSWSVQRPPQISRLGRGLAKSDDLDALAVLVKWIRDLLTGESDEP